MPSAPSPIVVLDSGLGGLTVVRAIRQVLPTEDIVYFGDTARLPYGSKSAATVTNFVRQIITYLHPLDPKHVVIACNTATALSMTSIRSEFADLPISGVIEPGARAAALAAGQRPRPVIGIIGTEATIRSRAYEQAIIRRRQLARVIALPTPLLAPIIEDGRSVDDPLVQVALKQYLQPLMTRSINVLVLGCTHYPIYREAISEMVGRSVAVIDSADQCAQDVQRRLASAKLLRDGGGVGGLRCFVTDNSPRFASLAARFLGLEIEPPTWVSTDELHALANPSEPLELPEAA
ncbi:MAG TPA: glutamate racemase [Tepidisphaeraceae bacterium]|nr:glutamate racemase [Tepidisphaeraceae bacterium]